MIEVVEYSCFEILTGKKKGKWRAVAQLKDRAGRALKPKEIERADEPTARDAMETWLGARNRLFASVDMTVAAMMDAYIERCKAKGRQASTVKGYKALIGRHIKPTIGHIMVKHLSAADVEMMMEGVPPKSAINSRSLLSAAIDRTVRKVAPEMANVSRLAEPDPYTPEVAEILTLKNFEKVMDEETDPVKRTMWLLYADTGVRPTEGRGLTWPELVEEEDGLWIHLRKSKTPEGLKPVPVSAALAEALKALPKTSVFIFPSPRTGAPYNERTISGYWLDAQERAEVPLTTMYALRHFFGSQKARTARDHVLKRLMRHKDIRTTKQYYVDAEREDLRKAVEK